VEEDGVNFMEKDKKMSEEELEILINNFLDKGKKK
jgi:hypothetical protein